jgi:hypothetical protein
MVRDAAFARHARARAGTGRPPELFEALQSEARVVYTRFFLVSLQLAGQRGRWG